MRISATRLVILGAVALLHGAPSVYAQQVRILFNGTDLRGWKAEFTQADVREGVLHVEDGSGWVRAEQTYSDFVLSLDVRTTATAGVYLRAWPTFDASSAPNNAFRLQLLDRDTSAAAKDGWRHLEIECVGRTVRVRLDGQVLSTADALENPQGFVALWSKGGAADFREVQIAELPLRRPTDIPGVFVVGGGVTSPRPLFQPKPRYTADAMRARINGAVSMSAVVLADGTVGDVTVIRSLDPKFGLDETAVALAKEWRFSPGTRDGAPVPVRIQIDLDFNLR